MIRSPFATIAVLLGAIAVGPSFVSTPHGASVAVVISQVYGGGGNAGAPFTNDFIELHNVSDTAVSLAGWSLQYASATGTGTLGASATQLTELSGTIPAGGYFLVQEGSVTSPNGVALPAPDVIDSTPIAMAAGAGKVALVDIATTLGCNGGSTPCSTSALGHIVDLVGYGNANFFEGSGPAPTLSNTTAAIRADAADTDDNSADFSSATPNPRNSGFTPPPPPPSGCSVPASHEISAVQGAGASTPFANQVVRVEGVVIGDFQGPGQLGGFYIQDDTPDANPSTSEGLFIFASAAFADVQTGQRVLVTGRAIEFNGLTELSPVSVVDVCGTGTIAATTVDLPRPPGSTFEPLENMLVTLPETLTATEHFQLGRFGEVTVSSGGRLFQPTDRVDAGASAIALQDLNNRRRLLIDDGSNVQNPAVVPFVTPGNALRLGDTTSGVTGVLTFGFGEYRLEPTLPVEFTRTNPRPDSPPPVGGEIRVASLNTLNYFTTLASLNANARGADTAQEFVRQQAKEVAGHQGACSGRNCPHGSGEQRHDGHQQPRLRAQCVRCRAVCLHRGSRTQCAERIRWDVRYRRDQGRADLPHVLGDADWRGTLLIGSRLQPPSADSDVRAYGRQRIVHSGGQSFQVEELWRRVGCRRRPGRWAGLLQCAACGAGRDAHEPACDDGRG
jgi:predicted extracellular nuclease